MEKKWAIIAGIAVVVLALGVYGAWLYFFATIPPSATGPVGTVFVSYQHPTLVVSENDVQKNYTITDTTGVLSVVEAGQAGVSLQEIAPGTGLSIQLRTSTEVDSVLVITPPTAVDSGEQTLSGVVQGNASSTITLLTSTGEVQLDATSARIFSLVESGQYTPTLEQIAAGQSLMAVGSSTQTGVFTAREIHLSR